ncbi:hypothetical protein [Actinokineospora sp.]|uniref:hypothetical protein n=1 Tax=Actinokineospora sp. TaxID=1872133 RepID=UPI003D6AB717
MNARCCKPASCLEYAPSSTAPLDTFFTASALSIAERLADAQMWELPGLEHFAPVLAPQSVAEESVTFFESARQPA